MDMHFLDHLFSPRAIAVFGASKRAESVGARVFDNLRKGGFTGPIYAINPKHKRLYRQRCYPSIDAIGKPVDLVVIAMPAVNTVCVQQLLFLPVLISETVTGRRLKRQYSMLPGRIRCVFLAPIVLV